ncbi:MAG: NusG domain II-containing protein [Firmicutes bacterium]|nr:NusG domain II-containing protein [Bacillota bacterium]
MKKRDFIFIFAVLILAAAMFFIINPRSDNADTVRITVDGKLFCEKPLSENCEIDINGTNTAVIENGYVYMKSATCPDKLCIHQGKACDGSKKIICLPNKVVIEVVKNSEIDTVVN